MNADAFRVDPPGQLVTYDIRMPSDLGAMMVRVAARSPEAAVRSAVWWFAMDPEGPVDTLSGDVTISYTAEDLPAFWTVED